MVACGKEAGTNTAQNASAPSKPAASLHCGKDTDCKGDRICEDGKCVSPTAGSAPALPAAEPATGEAAASDIPKFKDYPAPPVYTGAPGELDISSEFARDYRTRFRNAMKEGEVVFAGEYVLTGWGCGTGGCYIQALVNKRTGHVIETTFNAYSMFSNDKEVRLGEEIESLRADSTLLVTRQVSDDPPHPHFANFYVLENGQLKRIKQLPAPH
ncbi:hypothetical protein CO608_05395 [Lysobacteraceae bacterium NML08-0793]|nr:hypothetical protein CO608_05395 [Xanthomonadaceae bacterium NML08-0793]